MMGHEAARRGYERLMHGISAMDVAGEYDLPTMEPMDVSCDTFIGFNYAKSSLRRLGGSVGVHFFLDDYQFERCLADPRKYGEILRPASCVLTPDFSLFRDMTFPVKLMSVFKSRLLGHIWQQMGVTVVPTLQWAEPASYAYSFDGLPRGGTVAVSTIGCVRNKADELLFRRGMSAACEACNPSKVLLFGKPLDFECDAEVINVKMVRPGRKEPDMGGRGRSSGSAASGRTNNASTDSMVYSKGGVVRASNSAQKQLSFLVATASRKRSHYESVLNAKGVHHNSRVKARISANKAEEEVMSRVRDLNTSLESQAKKGDTFQVWGTRYDDAGKIEVFHDTRKKRW